jgi:outer membrane receptor protein involved in Fe transport
MVRRILALAIGVFWCGSMAMAQLPTGTILGTVTDASGASVAGATIIAKDVDTGASRKETTGEDGTYRFSALPVGKYEIDVSHEGFSMATLTDLTLTVAQEAVINVALKVGESTQSVSVSGEAPQIDTTTSSLGGLMSEQNIAELPLNGRNWNDLTLLQTGIANVSSLEADVRGIGGDIFLSNGAPQRSNNYMLDGAIMQNFYGMNTASVAQTSLGVDGIKEFKTITNLFGAEYGMTMGSQTTIVSKGGTNQLHGDVFEFIRNSALDARNYFDKEPTAVPPFRQNQFGGSAGGPIRKDKTFVYGVYEGFRNDLGITTIAGVPAAGCHGAAGTLISSSLNGPCPQIGSTSNPNQVNTVRVSAITAPFLANFPNPNNGSTSQDIFAGAVLTREDYGQIRVDENISSSDTLFARYTVDDTSQPGSDAYPNVQDVLASRNQYLTLSESHILSPTVLNAIRVSYSRTNFANSSTSTYNIPLVTGEPSGAVSIGGVTTGSLGIGPQSTTGSTPQDIVTGSDDVFWTKGKHALKFGVLINHYEQGITDNYEVGGTLAFASFANFLTGLTSTSSYTLTPPRGNGNRDYRFWTLGFYAQDDYRVSSRLTLNLGLRYEFNTTPTELNGREYAFRNFPTDTATTQGPVLQNASLKNLSPRIGLAWDVFGDGKTSLRSGFGIYYDIATEGSALQQDIIATPPLTAQGGSTTPTQLTGLLDVQFPIPPNFKGAKLQGVDYYAKQPYLMSYNLGVERQLPFDVALTASYVGSRGIHLWDEFTGTNDGVPTILANGDKFWSTSAPRINPFFGGYTQLTTKGDSYYNSLQVGLSKRVTHGLQFQTSYTYGKLIDTPQGQTVGHDVEISNSSDPFQPKTDKGPGESDLTHQVQFNMVYHLPSVHSDGMTSKLVNGWWVGNIASFQSGFAFSPTISFNNSNDKGGADRPDIVTAANVAAVRAGTYTRDGILGGSNPNAVPFNQSTYITGGLGAVGPNSGWFNPNMFVPGPPGLLGDAPRGLLRGPDLRLWNFSLVKDTKLRFLGEGGNLQFRSEFFNLLNHPNFKQPNGSTYTSLTGLSAISGEILGTSTTNREIQFGLRIEF